MTDTEADKTESKVGGGYAWTQLRLKVQEHRVRRVFALFRAADIEPVLIKGWAVAQYYPDDVLRESVDVDIAVGAVDYGKAEKLVIGREFDGLAVDVHRELRHLDSVAWPDLFANSRLIPSPSGEIRVLAPEDHLRVLCVHWLTDGGVNRDRLWDVYYLIDRRQENFDWERALETVDRNRRRWIECTIGLAHRYLGLDLKGTPIEQEASNLPEWLTETVEKAWLTGRTNQPLEMVLRDRKAFLSQLRMRFEQDPIWATIQMGGSLDARTRFFYKVALFFYRIPDSLRRVTKTLRLPRD